MTRSVHRAINSPGYVKIFPMSNGEDRSFCHYCGVTPDIESRLEWDHVPALNCKIPPECEEIRKTLVRSCRECNGLASDIPHMDYKERHFWLKARLLKRYRRLLVNEGFRYGDTSSVNGYLAAVSKNAMIRYEKTLHRIGFGVSDISQIDSALLQKKNTSGYRLEDVLINYLNGEPLDDELPEAAVKLTGKAKEYTRPSYTLSEFVIVIAAENEAGHDIFDQESYEQWVTLNRARFKILELPEEPEKDLHKSWFKLKHMIYSEIERLKRSTGLE